MFTGLIEAIGRIARVEPTTGGRRIWIDCETIGADARIGDSIAIDGCCLTVLEATPRGFTVEAVPETLARTTLGGWRAGGQVNLERSLRASDRLGGHFVLGHVDGVAEVAAVAEEGGGRRVRFELPEGLARFVAEKGSLTVDGASLTVAQCVGRTCEIAYIPHTLRVTVAGEYEPGRAVNIEVDVIARYVARLLEGADAARGAHP